MGLSGPLQVVKGCPANPCRTRVHLEAASSREGLSGEPLSGPCLATKLGDPSGVVAGPSSSARACMVSLALDGAHSPIEGEGWWAGLGV